MRRLVLLLSAAVLVGVPVAAAGHRTHSESSLAGGACQPKAARSLVLVSARTGTVDRSFPDVDRGVYAVFADGQGGWFVGGYFRCVGAVVRPSLAHLRSNGSLDLAWAAELPRASTGQGLPTVVSLARSGGTPYAAYAGGSVGVLALNATTGARLWQAPVTQSVLGVLRGMGVAVVAGPHAVYLGGDFRRVGGARRASVAALDPRTGRVLAWTAPSIQIGSGPGYVFTLALSGRRLFVGGSFDRVGGKPRSSSAALDTTNGALTAWTLVPAGGGDVDSILVVQDSVFMAGHAYFEVADSRTGHRLPLAGVTARRFASFGNIVYLGSDQRDPFTQAAGKPRNNLAALDLASGEITRWAPNVARYVSVTTIAASHDQVLVGGDFWRR